MRPTRSRAVTTIKTLGNTMSLTLFVRNAAFATFLSLGLAGANLAIAAPPASSSVVRLAIEFEAVFQPGVWNGWALGSASNTGGYIVEVTPLTNPAAGFFTHAIQQEFDDIGAAGWRDVARIQFNGTGPVTANVRIYSVGPK